MFCVACKLAKNVLKSNVKHIFKASIVNNGVQHGRARFQSHLAHLSKLEKQFYQGRINSFNEDSYPLIEKARLSCCSNVIRIPNFIEEYKNKLINNGEALKDIIVCVEGKIINIRKSSKKLVFIDILQDFKKLQVIYSLNTINQKNEKETSKDQFLQSLSLLKFGDCISIDGYPMRTKSGELSIRSIKLLNILSVSLIPYTTSYGNTTLTHSNDSISQLSSINVTKYPNYKVSNMITSPHSYVTPLIVKHIIVKSMRDYLSDKQGFIEVETPIIANTANGANATPFMTNSHHLKSENASNETDDKGINTDTGTNNELIALNLRIAPELYLKKLVIGGMDKVFEIGKVFRNEGIDSIHNPEFTTCEFYQSYTSLNELIYITEEILMTILGDIEKYFLVNINNGTNNDSKTNAYSKLLAKVIDLKSKFTRCEENFIDNGNGVIIKLRYFKMFEYIPTIEKQTGIQLPLDLSDMMQLEEYFKKCSITIPSARSIPNYLNKLASEVIEPLCDEPSLILNHPVELSPLAKSFVKVYDNGTRSYEVSNRFEMFIKGSEYINAYEEENDPFKQDKKFQMQLKYKETSVNDNEISMTPDHKFVQAMEYGMPPTGGWGCGIDRLTMLISDTKKIDDVLSFGNLIDVVKY